MKNFDEMKLKIDALTVFGAVKSDPVVQNLRVLLECFDDSERGGLLVDEDIFVSAYSNFVAAFYPYGSNFSTYIESLVLGDDNFYVKMIAAGMKVDQQIVDTVKRELRYLDDIASLSFDDVVEHLNDGASVVGFKNGNETQAEDKTLSFLPKWTTGKIHLIKNFSAKLSCINTTGYGIFAKYTFFRMLEGQIVPVTHPDYQNIDRLFEYERERDIIIKNTEALLSGEGASNMLLYGDMGTGKSSTIKAVAAAYSGKGLRIIEIKKNQLFQIPDIMEQLASNPLKFILFIDDLSFSGNDDNFSALKATLEGSISGCGENTVIYATSNRRHLVRESAMDREGRYGADDDLHLNDTLQETMSLAARFGLSITFSKPNKDEYLSIVRSLAVEYGLSVEDEDEFLKKAEAFAIRKNGRSPRTARQFIELQKIGI